MWSGETRRCELCKEKAQIHCASDQASLCWGCDAEVHSANFLVARHSRNLLCRVCQGLTPWSASGYKLGPTASVCERCGINGSTGDEEPEVMEENQVVPWSPLPPPPAERSSSVEEAASSGEAVVVLGKRFRADNASRNIRSDEDEISSSSLKILTPPPEAASSSPRRKVRGRTQRKNRRMDPGRIFWIR